MGWQAARMPERCPNCGGEVTTMTVGQFKTTFRHAGDQRLLTCEWVHARESWIERRVKINPDDKPWASRGVPSYIWMPGCHKCVPVHPDDLAPRKVPVEISTSSARAARPRRRGSSVAGPR